MTAVFLLLSLLVLCPIASVGAQPVLHLSTNRVACHAGVEMRVEWSRNYTNPFNATEVRMELEVAHTSGERFRVPAFYGQDYERVRSVGQGRVPAWLYPGDAGWRARFAPLREGRHEAVVRVKDAAGEHVSAPVVFLATPATSPGYVRVSRNDPRFLELGPARLDKPGQPFFPIGQNLAFIGDGQYVSLDRAEEIFAKLSANGANYLRIWTCCQDWAIAIEASKSAFGRSWEGQKPIVRRPDDPMRSCIRLSPANATVRVNPSHRVALRPQSEYVLTGRWQGVGAGLRVEIHSQQAGWSAKTPDWQSFTVKFRTRGDEHWLGTTAMTLDGDGEVYVTDLSLKEVGGSVELLWEADVNRQVLGTYNQPDCFMVDELVKTAERERIYLQLCLLSRDLYMKRLEEPGSAAYEEAIADAKNFMRYAVARWGYSTAVAS